MRRGLERRIRAPELLIRVRLSLSGYSWPVEARGVGFVRLWLVNDAPNATVSQVPNRNVALRGRWPRFSTAQWDFSRILNKYMRTEKVPRPERFELPVCSFVAS
jgi:hypothetical protein